MNNSLIYLIEIRKRLLRYILLLVVVLIITSCYGNRVYDFLAIPLLKHIPHLQGLISISLPAAFLVPLKSAFFVSLLLTVPYLLYEFWLFVSPALYRHERRHLWILFMMSLLLFYSGILFAYFLILPLLFQFILLIAPRAVEIKPDIDLYFSFILQMFLSFGIAFEIPVLIIIAIWTNITTVEKLRKKRPYIIVAAFIIGMVLTPPDVISQLLLALPIWLLYEIGLILAKCFEKNHRCSVE